MFDAGSGGPSEEEIQQARRLRSVANDLFHVAMQEMNVGPGRVRPLGDTLKNDNRCESSPSAVARPLDY